MPRPVSYLPKYRKHKASGQAVVTLGGRDFYLGPHGTKASKREYDRRISEWLASGRTRFNRGETLTIFELAAAYLRHAREFYGVGDNAETHRIKRIIRPLRQLYGRTNADDFGPLEFKAVRQQLISDGLARANVNAMMRRLLRLFRWAVAEGKLQPSILEALRAVDGLRRGKSDARETKPVGPVDEALVEATLPHLPPIVADMVRVQRLAGMRPAEVCMMRPCDIERSGDVWVYQPQRHKTEHHGHSRTIFLGSKAQTILTPYLDRAPQAFCFSPRESESRRRAALTAARKTPLSCGNRLGTNRKRRPRRQPSDCYSPGSYHQAVRQGYLKAFPVPDEIADDPAASAQWRAEHRWFPNQLRHAAATEIRKRFGLEAAQVILGHSKADVTQVYAERDYEKGIAVAREIG